MGSDQDRRSRASGMADRRGGEDPATEFAKLVVRAPQFKALAKVAQGEEGELTKTQQEFLDNFTAGLTQGVAESERGLKDAEKRSS